MRALRRTFVVSVIATGLWAGPVASAADLLSLDSDTRLATAGYYQLRWDTADFPTRLVESTSPSFTDARVIYAGPDTARLISGKPDGDYYYRLESAAGSREGAVVSDILEVSVAHHSLARAFSFFGVGAVVFAATLGLILFGGRSERG